MHLASFLIVALSVFFPAQTEAQVNPANTGGAGTPATTGATGSQPTIISMNCASAYMPLSDADLYAMQHNGTAAPADQKLSTTPTEAACKGTDIKSPDGGICDLKSCSSPQPVVCPNCFETSLENGQVSKVSSTPVAQVKCDGGYFFDNSNSQNISNICTGSDQKTYTCNAQCQNVMACTSCVSLDDPALASTSP